MQEIFLAFITIVAAYLIGSISSAIIVCKLSDLPDPRTEGSKNPGTTNVLRLGGKKFASLVLAGDMLKGLIPLWIAHIFGLSVTAMALTCLAAVLGHIYPVFFNFQGGKGVATALGAFLGFHFIMGVAAIATWLLIINFTRFASLASIITICLMPFYALYAAGSMKPFIPMFIISIFVLYKHRENISRLVIGTEPKITLSNRVSANEQIEQIPKPINDIQITKKTPKKTALKKRSAPKKETPKSPIKKQKKTK